MIENMKKVFVVAKLQERKNMLKALREAGLVHVKMNNDQSNRKMDELNQKVKELEKIKIALEEIKTSPEEQKDLSEKEFLTVNSDLSKLLDQQKEIDDQIARLNLASSNQKPYGDYNPKDLEKLAKEGIVVNFYTLGKKELSFLKEDVRYVRLKDLLGQAFIAVFDKELPEDGPYIKYVPSSLSLTEITKRLEELNQKKIENNLKIIDSKKFLDSYKYQIANTQQSFMFEKVLNNTIEEGELCYLQGFVPESQVTSFKTLAKENRWAYLLEEVKAEDEPPTKVVYNKISALCKPIFTLLGTVPGYYEYDISTYFLLFFSLFFAMIVGDAGYGVLFLVMTMALQKKSKKVTELIMLLYVLSASTIVWGAVTGTWFGSQTILEKVSFLQIFVIKQFTNFPNLVSGLSAADTQKAVMKFSFQIGTLQLSLACVMNVISKLKKKDLSAIAEIGWLAVIDALYFVVLLLVIGEEINTTPIFTIVGVGFLVVVVFGSQGPGIPFAKGLASGLGGFFNTFLDTISSFGNIMSYIRLFAVGMASLAISQSFNNMAQPLLSGFALPAGIIVLVLGHSLNIVMAMLSVIVHGVRLNVLEFSGQLGMEWTGILYEPFKKTIESK